MRTTNTPPVCVPCKRAMRFDRAGVIVEFTAVSTQHKRPSADEGPYQKISGDQFVCPGCGAQVIGRWAEQGVEHFQPEYAEYGGGAHDIVVAEFPDRSRR